MATIKDVASRAGVSIGSVSAVINQKSVTSAALREKVYKAIEELGYSPHGGARGLRVGRTKSIGLLVADINNPHFSSLASAIELACDRAGYTLSLGNALGDLQKEIRHIQLFRRQRVDGLILSLAGHGKDYIEMIRKSVTVPTVLIDQAIEGLNFDTVKLDNVRAGRLVMEYLLRIGHRRMAIFIGPLRYETSIERLQGCLDAIRDFPEPIEEPIVIDGNFDIDVSHRETVKLLSGPVRPTALVAISNHMTLGIMKGLADQGFRCPRDISVIGIDDLPTATAFSPRLTAAVQPTAEMGQAAVDFVLRRLQGEGDAAPMHFLGEPRLIVRDSCQVLDPS